MIRLKLQIDKLLTLENSRIKHLSLPMSCSSKQLSQRRGELLGSLDSIEIRTLLGNFSHLLFKLTKTLKKMAVTEHKKLRSQKKSWASHPAQLRTGQNAQNC